MTRKRLAGLLTAVLSLTPQGVRAADTLVVAGEGGVFHPGLAKSWSAEGEAMIFLLADGTDGARIATVLGERLAQAQIALEGTKLTIRGIPSSALLEQLATLDVSGEGDPLAALAGLGGGVPANEGPEAGGSIRASKPIPLPNAVLGAMASAAEPGVERLEAEVVDVGRGTFPQVTLKLRFRRASREGPLKGKIAAGSILETPVLLAGSAGAVDFTQAATQRNLGAYYLRKGDRVLLRAVEAGGRIVVDWIERK